MLRYIERASLMWGFRSLFPKFKILGPFWEKRVWTPFFRTFFLLRGYFCTNLHEILAPGLKLIFQATLFYKKIIFDRLYPPPILTKKQPNVAIFDKTYFWGLRYPLMVLPQRLGNKGVDFSGTRCSPSALKCSRMLYSTMLLNATYWKKTPTPTGVKPIFLVTRKFDSRSCS